MSFITSKAITNVSSILSKRWYADSKRPYIVRKVIVIKSLGLFQLIYQESVLDVPGEIEPVVKTKLERVIHMYVKIREGRSKEQLHIKTSRMVRFVW